MKIFTHVLFLQFVESKITWFEGLWQIYPMTVECFLFLTVFEVFTWYLLIVIFYKKLELFNWVFFSCYLLVSKSPGKPSYLFVLVLVVGLNFKLFCVLFFVGLKFGVYAGNTTYAVVRICLEDWFCVKICVDLHVINFTLGLLWFL